MIESLTTTAPLMFDYCPICTSYPKYSPRSSHQFDTNSRAVDRFPAAAVFQSFVQRSAASLGAENDGCWSCSRSLQITVDSSEEFTFQIGNSGLNFWSVFSFKIQRGFCFFLYDLIVLYHLNSFNWYLYWTISDYFDNMLELFISARFDQFLAKNKLGEIFQDSFR